MENLSPLKQNGVNVGQVGVPWPERTLVEETVNAEHGYVINVTGVKDLSWLQPFEADVLSLTQYSLLRMSRQRAENLLQYYSDLLRSKENFFRTSQEPTVMARVILQILRFMNRNKVPCMDQAVGH